MAGELASSLLVVTGETAPRLLLWPLASWVKISSSRSVMEEAEAVCDRVAIIDHGALLTCETPQNRIAKHKDDPEVREVAHGEVTLEDVFIGLTGSAIRE